MKKLIAVIVLAATLLTSTAFAQIDPSEREYLIFQNGHVVGEIYVPARVLTAARYVEHWVLYPDYVYPNGEPGLNVEIRAGSASFRDEQEFFRNCRWGGGFRYVRVDSTDTNQLPIRR